MTNGAFDEFFGGPPRKPETLDERARVRHRGLRAEGLRGDRAADGARPPPETGLTNLCMAGGVALNCVANGRIVRETPMKNLFVQPAAGDAGGALGVAHYVYNTLDEKPRGPGLDHAYLGPGVLGRRDRASTWTAPGASTRRCSDEELIARTAQLLSEENVDRLVPGPHGVRPARARRPQHPGRPARPGDARHAQPEDQVPRELPAVRALGARGEGVGVVRDRLREPVHAAGGAGARGQARHPVGHPRRRLRAHPDGHPRRAARSTTT